MIHNDDDLSHFEKYGAEPLPRAAQDGYVAHAGANIWYSIYGSGPTVILLHGGLGNSGNWGYQVPALANHGYSVLAIDTRGHGRSTRDHQPFSYELLASDVLAVMDSLGLAQAALVGWSDGACTSLVMARRVPQRVTGVFFFACNMDPSGAKPFKSTPVIAHCFARHKRDYAELSATPAQFDGLVKDVTQMQTTQPNFSKQDLMDIHVPVMIAQSEHDEFIKSEHARYLAQSIPGASLTLVRDVSHFAPLQRPDQFNELILEFLHKTSLNKATPSPNRRVRFQANQKERSS
jgi:pimeloyl-ACP methyl ester carboxylesterase